MQGLTESNSGPVQVVVADIDSSDSQPHKICRLKQHEMKDDIIPDLLIQSYTGPKKSSMPINLIRHCVPLLKILVQHSIQYVRASNLVFQFFKAIVTDSDSQN